MSSRKLKNTPLLGAFGGMLALTISSQILSAEPITLSDNQLDHVTAGFLAITVAADAQAVSQIASTFTDTLTISDVTVGPPRDDGYTYTTGQGLAAATAIGEQVQTSVAAAFETTQQVVSVETTHGVSTRIVEPAAPEIAGIQVQANLEAQQRNQQAADRRAAREHRANERQAQQQQVANQRAESQAAAAATRAEQQAVAAANLQAAHDENNALFNNPDRRAERQAERAAARAERQAQQAAQRLARQQERAASRRTQQEERAANVRNRQETREAARVARQNQRAAERQARQEARARAQAARRGVPQVVQQTQVLELRVVTRRPSSETPL